jgi:hypothetical protein
MIFINVTKLFIYFNVIFVLKGLFYFCTPKISFLFYWEVRGSSDFDTSVPKIWRVLRDRVCSEITNLAGFRLCSSKSVWFNILE